MHNYIKNKNKWFYCPLCPNGICNENDDKAKLILIIDLLLLVKIMLPQTTEELEMKLKSAFDEKRYPKENIT